jgi:hypothetical protein
LPCHVACAPASARWPCHNAPPSPAHSVLEAQNFSGLTHRQSLGWHGAPGVIPVRVPSVDDCSWSASPPLRGWPTLSESVAGMDRNHWPLCLGMRMFAARAPRTSQECPLAAGVEPRVKTLATDLSRSYHPKRDFHDTDCIF